MQRGFAMVGLLLSVGILILLMYFTVFRESEDMEDKPSTYTQGMEAIDDAEEIKKILEARYQ